MIPNCKCASTIMTFLYKNCNCNFFETIELKIKSKYTLKRDNFKFSRVSGEHMPPSLSAKCAVMI